MFWVLGVDTNFWGTFQYSAQGLGSLEPWEIRLLQAQPSMPLWGLGGSHGQCGWWGREPVRSRGRWGPGSQGTLEQALLTPQGAGLPGGGVGLACCSHPPPPAAEGWLACLQLRPSAETES